MAARLTARRPLPQRPTPPRRRSCAATRPCRACRTSSSGATADRAAHWLRFLAALTDAFARRDRAPLRDGGPAHPRHRHVLPRSRARRGSTNGRLSHAARSSSTRLNGAASPRRGAARRAARRGAARPLRRAPARSPTAFLPAGRDRRQRRVICGRSSACMPPGRTLRSLRCRSRAWAGRPLVGARRPHAGAFRRRLCPGEPARPVARLSRRLRGDERRAPGALLRRPARRPARGGAALASRASACSRRVPTARPIPNRPISRAISAFSWSKATTSRCMTGACMSAPSPG